MNKKLDLEKDLQFVLNEIFYCTGRKATKQEAKEIIWFTNNNHSSLEEVIEAYYSVDY